MSRADEEIFNHKWRQAVAVRAKLEKAAIRREAERAYARTGLLVATVRAAILAEREACAKIKVPISRMNFSTLEREAAEWAVEEYRLRIRARPAQ